MADNKEQLLEAILENQDSKMSENNSLLEASLTKENNTEPLLEASLMTQNDIKESLNDMKPEFKKVSGAAEFVMNFMEAIKGDKGDTGDKGEKGDKGNDGYTPEKGKDYFTDEEIEQIISSAVDRIPVPKDGQDGIDGRDGKDGLDGKDGQDTVIDYDSIISEVVKKLPKVKKITEKSPEQIAESLRGKISYNDLKDLPTIFKGMAGQGYLKNLADVNISGMTDGQTLVKSGDKFIPADSMSIDEKVKLSASDPSAGYLNDKLSAGAGITYNNGVITNNNPTPYTLPTASGLTKGGVKIGARLTMTGDTLSADVQAGGDVSGPSSAVDSNFASYDGTTGKLIKDSGSKASDFATAGHNHTGVYQPVGSYEVTTNKSTSVTTDGSSDTKYPSVKAVKDYADGLVAGLLDYRGSYDASGNTFPATGGSGAAGAILKGDMWVISVAGTLGGSAVQVGDSIIANTDTPGQTASNWDTLNTNISYVPEDSANKVTSISGSSTDTQYPSAKLLYDQLALKLDEKVKVSSDDTTSGYVEDKLSAGTGISLSTTSPGGNEVREITNTAPDQTVTLTGAGSASVSGTYPNFTITGNSGANINVGNEFFLDDTSIVSQGVNSLYPVKTLSRTPITTAEDVDTITVSSGTSPSIYGFYKYNTGLGVLSIPADIWNMSFWLGVDSATGVTNAAINFYTARPESSTVTITGTGTSRTATSSGGTPFATTKIDASATVTDASFIQTPNGIFQITARTSDTVVTIATPTTYTNESGAAFDVYKKRVNVTSDEINNTATGPSFTGLVFNDKPAVDGNITTETTDKLAIMVYATTTSVASRSVYFSHNGTQRYSHVHIPIFVDHNNLANLNVGDFQHLTVAEKADIVTKTSYDANTILAADTDNTPTAITIPTNALIGRIASGFVSVPIDSDLSSTSAGDDTVPSAKATKTALDAKAPLASPTFTGTVTLPVGLTGVLRADTGVVSVDTDVTDLVSAASDTVAGKVELATITETNTGTDATRAVTPDGLAGSYAGTKNISIQVLDGATALATGDGKAYLRVPVELNGMNIVSCSAQVIVKSTSGNPTFMITRGRQANATSDFTYVDVLSTAITIDANEYDSKDATTAAVINASNDDLATGDVIRIDVDGAGTGTKGLNVTISCRLP